MAHEKITKSGGDRKGGGMSTRATIHLGHNFHAYDECLENEDSFHIAAGACSRGADMQVDIRINLKDETALCDALLKRREWRAKLAAKKGGAL